MAAPSDYVPVNKRIQEFYDRYPEGSLQSLRPPEILEVGGKAFVVYAAAAYRTADDTRPGVGWAWEPVPGPTNFTRDSELMNAETSAWGRAIAALGFEVKNSVATREDVQNRTPDVTPPGMTQRQRTRLAELLADPLIAAPKVEAACNRDWGHGTDKLTGPQATTLIAQLEQFLKTQVAAGRHLMAPRGAR